MRKVRTHFKRTSGRPINLSLSLFLSIVTLFEFVLPLGTALGQDRFRVRDHSPAIFFLQAVARNPIPPGTRVLATASGFVITHEGHLLTAAHLIQRDNPSAEYFASWSPRYMDGFKLTLINSDADLDIALFQLPAPPPYLQAWSKLTIASSAAVPDEAHLYVLGFAKGQELSLAEGNLRTRYGPGGRFVTSLPINYGDSGSPVFDIGGRVVGMAEGGFDEANLVTIVAPSDFFAPIMSLAGLPQSRETSTSFSSSTSQGVLGKPRKVISAPYSFTVGSDEHRQLDRTICVDTGFKIVNLDVTVTSKNGNDTHIISSSVINEHCVLLRVYVAGNGVDLIGGIIVNYRGRGWIAGSVNVTTE